MKIYDIDKDLNRLLNEPGMNKALKEYVNKFFWSRLLGYISIAILVVGAGFSFFFTNEKKNLIIIIFVIAISFLASRHVSKIIDERNKKIYDSSVKVYKIISRKYISYDLEYLVHILNIRIQQSKHVNDGYKKTINTSYSLLGVNFLYGISLLIKSKIEKIGFNPVGVIKISSIIIFILLVTSVLIELRNILINNSVTVEKWQCLLNHVTKLKLKSNKIKN